VKTLGVLGKLTGKVKYFVAVIFAVLVFLNKTYQLGMTEDEILNIMIVFLAALGVDGFEGAVAMYVTKGKAPAKKGGTATDESG
jgi:hypothetical protein